MNINWKNVLITFVTAWVGVTIINKFVVPLLPDSIKKFIS